MIGCIIQARFGSSRLPGKVLRKLDDNKTMLDYVLDQLEHSKEIDKVIVATTTLSEDDVIVKFVEDRGIQYFRGHPTDVLDRYYNCANKFSIDKIVRINSDCPLIEPSIVDKMIIKFNEDKFDYVTNYQPRSFPYGMDVEVFSLHVLKIAWINAILPSEREHVTPYIYNHPNIFRNFNVNNDCDNSNIRIVVDREKDLELVQNIVSKIKIRPIKLHDIIMLYEHEPHMFSINQEYKTDEGYLKSLMDDKTMSEHQQNKTA